MEGGQSARVPDKGEGMPTFGDDPQITTLLPPSVPLLPLPSEGAPLSHYKGTALRFIGRDSRGRVLPHKYSSKTAKHIAIWIAGGYNVNDICVALNIRPGLLRELYGKEINHGLEMVGMDVTTHIVDRVKKSDRMAIFFAKSRMGWRDGDSQPIDTGVLAIHIHT